MDTKTLALNGTKVRLLALEAVHTAASGHIGGSLSAADILTTLYFHTMKVDPKQPTDPNRDRFVLSKGHCTPGLYATLALRGYFPLSDLALFRSVEGHYSGHPDMNHVRGVDMSTGSLGQGLSAAVGMALAAKVDGADYRTYALLGDGELAEGQIWEAAMAAAKFGLDNLCAIVDVNGLQIDGKTADVMPTEPLDQKFASFGFHVLTVDGHSYDQLINAFETAKTVSGKPTVILTKTVKGKGVSYMENNAGWHGKAPNDEQFAQGRSELLELLGQQGWDLAGAKLAAVKNSVTAAFGELADLFKEGN